MLCSIKLVAVNETVVTCYCFLHALVLFLLIFFLRDKVVIDQCFRKALFFPKIKAWSFLRLFFFWLGISLASLTIVFNFWSIIYKRKIPLAIILWFTKYQMDIYLDMHIWIVCYQIALSDQNLLLFSEVLLWKPLSTYRLLEVPRVKNTVAKQTLDIVS